MGSICEGTNSGKSSPWTDDFDGGAALLCSRGSGEAKRRADKSDAVLPVAPVTVRAADTDWSWMLGRIAEFGCQPGHALGIRFMGDSSSRRFSGR